MNRITTTALATLLATSLGAGPLAAPAEKEKPQQKEGDPKHEPGKKADEHAGEKKDLGTQNVGGFDVQVTQVGDVKPGEEAVFILKPKGDGKPKGIRAWVGVEGGKGSIKTKAEEEAEGEWHAHHQVSKPLPAGSKFWVEVETAAGKRQAAFAIK